MEKPLTTIVMSMYNTRQPTIEVIDKVFFPGLINNASSDKQLILLDDCSPAQEETQALAEKHRPELEKRFGDVFIGRNKQNLGFAQAVNIGVRKATGKYIFITNNDVIFTKDCLNALLKTFQGSKLVGLVGPKILFQDTKKLAIASLKVNPWLGYYQYDKSSSHRRREADYIPVDRC